MNKQCTKCSKKYPLTQFNLKHGKPQSVCKKCHAIYRRDHYLENRSWYIDKAYRLRKEKRQVSDKLISTYLSNHPCVDCGETDIVVLQFDHKSRANKVKPVSRMMDYSWGRIQKEIDKCEVRCANCHIRRTAKQLKWKTRKTQA